MNNQLKLAQAVISDTSHSPFALLRPVSLTNVSLDSGFWKSRLEVNLSVTLKTQYEMLVATGRLDNFLRAAGKIDKPYQGLVFNDSDVYKWLEAASWSLVYRPDPELRSMVDRIIRLIADAQQEDGYLNTYFSLDNAVDRWTNLQTKHELYCAGHLIQAAVAHYRVTAEKSLLGVAIRLADHIYATFGPSGREGTSGHPEIEMALVELYRTTGNERYLALAKLFIDRRGRGLLGGSEYLIDHAPFRSLNHLVGHAVRALYLCSGATDVVLETGEQELTTALERLWTHMVQEQMYITGGLGARHEGEAFGEPYELPNARAYAESCASVASLMWNWRMLQLAGEPRYADLLEWTLYNAVLPGISLDGRQYFYVNPLQSSGNDRRQAWFECACCPPNTCRTLAMLPGYIYSLSPEGVWVHLYAASQAHLDLANGQRIGLRQITSYPWDGHITIEMTASGQAQSAHDDSADRTPFSLFLRLPGWLIEGQVEVKVNEEVIDYPNRPCSYLEIYSAWQNGDRIDIDFPMPVRYLESHPLVLENTGRVALTRGPLVYCVEAVDNPGIRLPDITLDTSAQPVADYRPEMLGGIVLVTCPARVRRITSDTAWEGKLYRPIQHSSGDDADVATEVRCIPYFAWANREPGDMQVWLRHN